MSLLGQQEAPTQKVSPRAEVEKAYEFFKAHPWIQGMNEMNMPDGQVGYCTNGVALYYDSTRKYCDFCNENHSSASEHAGIVFRYLNMALPRDDEEIGIVMWNDTDGRTREEVDFLWQKAIVLAHMEETKDAPQQD